MSSGVLPALAHPARRKVVELLSDRPRTAGELYQAIPMAGPAVSRHLRVLREAGLISEQRLPQDARVRLYALEMDRLDELTRWLQELRDHWTSQLLSFKRFAESQPAQ